MPLLLHTGTEGHTDTDTEPREELLSNEAAMPYQSHGAGSRWKSFGHLTLTWGLRREGR
jgi:hypothetical protein